MKVQNVILLSFLFFLLTQIFSQTNNNQKNLNSSIYTDEYYINYFIKNGFGGFTFNEDGTYRYGRAFIGARIKGDGTYSIQNGLLYLKTFTAEKEDHYDTSFYWPLYEDNMDRMQIPGEYRIDLKIVNLHYKGALININDGRYYWSMSWAPSYAQINYEGTICIRYPWRNEDAESRYILILENLRLRKYPSIKSEVASVEGYGGNEGDVGYLYSPRSVEFAGTISTIRAKTVKEDTIDGITAPWYLIVAYGVQFGEEPDFKYVWVFGGYTKEIESSEIDFYQKKYRTTLEKALILAGGSLKKQESDED